MPYTVPPTEGSSPLNLDLKRPRDRRFLLRLASGDNRVDATVRDRVGPNTYRLSINGEVIQARIEEGEEYAPGDRLRLRISSDDDGGLRLQILRHFRGSGKESTQRAAGSSTRATSRSIMDLLQTLDVEDNETNRTIVKSMVKFQLPISENVFRRLSSIAQTEPLLEKASRSAIVDTASQLESSGLSYSRDTVSFLLDVFHESNRSYPTITESMNSLIDRIPSESGRRDLSSRMNIETLRSVQGEVRALAEQILSRNIPGTGENMAADAGEGRAGTEGIESLPEDLRSALRDFLTQFRRILTEASMGHPEDPGERIQNTKTHQQLTRHFTTEEQHSLNELIRRLSDQFQKQTAQSTATGSGADISAVLQNEVSVSDQDIPNRSLKDVRKLLTKIRMDLDLGSNQPDTIKKSLQTLIQETVMTRSMDGVHVNSGNITGETESASRELQSALDRYLKSRPQFRLIDDAINTIIKLIDLEGTASTGTGSAEPSIDAVVNNIRQLIDQVAKDEITFSEAKQQVVEVLKNTDASTRPSILSRLEAVEKNLMQNDPVTRELTQLLKHAVRSESATEAMRLLDVLQSRPGKQVYWVRVPSTGAMNEPGFLRFEIRESAEDHDEPAQTKDEDQPERSGDYVTTVGIHLSLSSLGTVTGKIELAENQLSVRIGVADQKARDHLTQRKKRLEQSLTEIDPNLEVHLSINEHEEEPRVEDLLPPGGSGPDETKKVDLTV